MVFLLLFLANLVNTLSALAHRSWNYRSVEQYLTAINAGNLPVEETETLTMEQLRLEGLYLGLRTKKGVYLEDFKNQYDCDLFAEKKKMLDRDA